MPDKNKVSLKRVVVTSFVVDISDVVMNVIIAIISGSVVMLSQALEGAADLITSGLLLVGLVRSKKPSDKQHPFGYGRELYFWTFLAALVTMVLSAGLSFYYGYKRFIDPHPIRNLELAFLALSIAIVTNGYSFSLSYKRLIGKRSFRDILKIFNHSILIETKTTFVTDLIGTVASVLGVIALLFFAITGDLRYDGVGAMAIGVSLAFLSYFLLSGVKDLLVGRSATAETEKKIIETAEEDENVQKVLDLRTMLIGPDKLLINMELHLQDELTTDEIEVLIDKIKEGIKSEVPTATHIQIELETPDTELKQ